MAPKQGSKGRLGRVPGPGRGVVPGCGSELVGCDSTPAASVNDHPPHWLPLS